MASDFTYRELMAVAEARSLIKLHAEGSLADDQMVIQFLIQNLVIADCPRVVLHCASLLPKHFHSLLRDHLDSLRSKNYFGEIVGMAPGPSAEAQAALQPTFRAVAQALEDFLANPVAPEDVPDVEVNHFWLMLHEQPRRAGVRCKQEGCHEEAMALSVMCPRHHYEMLYGGLPRGIE